MARSQDSLRLREQRDPTGYDDSALLRGSFVAPAWTVMLFGASVVLTGLLYFVWRARRARRHARFSLPSAKRG